MRRFLLSALTLVAIAPSNALAVLPTDYAPAGMPSLPAGAWDVGPDGRIVAIVGSTIVRQDTVAGAAFAPIGSVPVGTVSSFGASFLSISPDGSTIALGDNGFTASARVHLVSTGALTSSSPTPTTSVVAPNFAAAWASGSQLYVSGGLFGSPAKLTRIDIAPALTASTVIHDIPDASGGVAVHAGSVYTGIGFGPREGEVRSFSLPALAGPSPVSFNSGSTIATLHSAGSIDFDLYGNLIVAGAGGVTITNLSGSSTTFSPLGTAAFYAARYNSVTEQVLVQGTDFGTGASGAFAYAVPAPPAAMLIVLSGAACSRRRRAR